jgi:hypothetical protein
LRIRSLFSIANFNAAQQYISPQWQSPCKTGESGQPFQTVPRKDNGGARVGQGNFYENSSAS